MNDFQYATACGLLGIGLVVYVQFNQGLAKQPFWQQADVERSQQQIESQQSANSTSPTSQSNPASNPTSPTNSPSSPTNSPSSPAQNPDPEPIPEPQHILKITDYELSNDAPDVDWGAVTDPSVRTQVIDRLGQCIGYVKDNQLHFIKTHSQACGGSHS
jgi:cytoskeletal protein RodZ